MIYAEEIAEVFERGKGSYLAHCISGDFALEEGIATCFRDMGIADLLSENFSEIRDNYKGACCLETTAGSEQANYKGVFNLVTKEKCGQKPTYESLKVALIDMREQIEKKHKQGEKEIIVCMPPIESDLDGLSWDSVRDIITDVFIDTDVLIIICRRTPEEW